MVRLLVTADWQIGMQAAHVASAATKVRAARLEAAQKVVEVANELEVDALVLAGDTFEDNQVSSVLAHKVLEILRACQAPVYVLPGNHDPWGPDSVLKKAWRQLPEHVRILSTPDPVSVASGSATLYPCPVYSKTSRQDPTEVIPPRQAGDGIRIGVAHGSLRIPGQFQEDDFPIPLEAAQKRGLDLLVVGHWHSLYRHPSPEATTVLYPGTHEQTKFDETDPGNVCLVTVAEAAGPVQVKRIRTGKLRWVELKAPIEQSSDLERLERELRALPEAADTLVSVELSGVASLAVLEGLRRLQEDVVPALGFLHLRWRGDVAQEPSDPELEELMTTPVLGQVVSCLRSEVKLGGVEGERARQALRILWSIEGGRRRSVAASAGE
jgi:DNA repair exonuclease SbcCD nuclease subunit